MKRLDNTALWEILNTPDNLPATGAARLYGVIDEFIAVIHSFCREERNIAERIRTLNDLHGKLASYLEDKSHASQKCALLRVIIKRAIAAIDSELFLVKMDLEHPERFAEPPAGPPLVCWRGSVNDLIELYVPIQASGLLQNPSGKPMNFEETCEHIEKIYGITISNPSDRRGKVLNRQKNTAFHDEMRRVLLSEADKRNR